MLEIQKSTDLGILAQVSDAQAIAFSLPHQATALEKHTLKYEFGKDQ
jgi:hypothetical protein